MTQAEQSEQRERARIQREFSASLMSDTKWRKLITALDRPDLELTQVVVKFIDTGNEFRLCMPKQGALHPPRPYIATSEFGPITLRSIEWLEIPTIAVFPRPPHGPGVVPPQEVAQDVVKARIVLDDLGEFPIEETGRGLRIVGHVRQKSGTST